MTQLSDMSTFNVGVRKYVENNKLQYWLLINAKATDTSEHGTTSQIELIQKTASAKSVHFINHMHWKIFIICTILINCCTLILALTIPDEWVFNYMIFTHFSCFFYWIDFIAAIAQKIVERKKKSGVRTTRGYILFVDAVSLLPLSAVYLMMTPRPNRSIFTALRFLTVLRLHQVLAFFNNLTMSSKNHWKVLVLNHLTISFLFAEAFFCYLFVDIDNFSPVLIGDWNDTVGHRLLVAWYLCVQTMFNAGNGDIVPVQVLQRSICIIVAILGCSQMGVLTGILTTAFSNSDKRREGYRDDYESTMKILKERRIDKKVQDKISENMMTIWKYKRSLTGPVNIQILPLSLQKEICFDMNFGLLNRSLIFSTQPRSFLRSVSLFMKSVSYLPGDIIMEPFGMTDAMLCVASGVIEVVSEENDETVLFSLTSGTIIGEATLFVSIPMRCIIRAATYVELQVLMKLHFSRLALKYQDIIRSMRSEIYYRLRFRDNLEPDRASNLDTDFQEISRRKETKRFLQDLRKKRDKNAETRKFRVNAYKSAILSLYVLSENIPTAKTLPVTLIRARPWILRPNTTLIAVWQNFVLFVVVLVVFIYPIYAAFKRSISLELYVFMVFVEAVYVVDLYIECTTAIESRDKYTFITSIKDIVAYKLKTIGLYLDILATYDFGVFAKFGIYRNPWLEHDYVVLLLSLNRVLKVWRLVGFFHRLEDNLKSTLLLVRTVKYFFFFFVAVVWAAAVLYLEACPWKTCDQDRWFSQLQIKKPDEFTEDPLTISFYFAIVTLSGVSYGDILPAATIDCVCDTIAIMVGVAILTVCMSQTSATFKHMARVRLKYQSEVFAVDRFMSEHDIPKDLTTDVRNYLQLQWNYDRGFSLMNNGTTEGLPLQQRQVIVMELMKQFLTVPLFRAAGNDFLRLLARSSKVRLLPPNDVITDAGSPDREMFILEKGYCEVSTTDEAKVIGPVNPFGYYEMIVGTPLRIKVRTLTHARIITLNYSAYLRAVTRYPSVKTQIDDSIDKDYIAVRSSFATFGFKPIETILPAADQTNKQKQLLSKPFINVCKYNAGLSLNYWHPFKAWGKLRFCQFLFFPFVIAPNSLFIKIWSSLRILNVTLIGLVAPVYFSLPNHSQQLLPLFSCLQAFTAVDMYLMFHLAYYDARGLLMFHPAKTVTWYLKGNFIIDLLTLFPHFWVVRKAFPPDDSTPSLLYDGLGLIMVLQFYKYIQGCYFLENDILRKSEILKILKFVPLAVILTNFITGFMVLLQCSGRDALNPAADNATNKLAAEWKETIVTYCSPDSHNATTDTHYRIFKMYLVTLYWVAQTMTGCGFGDITPQNRTTMIAAIVIIVLGIFLFGYMFADLTSGMITAYVLVTKYRRRIWEMSVYVKDKDVDPTLHKRLVLHYEYNWQRTEGAQPQKIFTCVHTALRQSIMASMYEDTVHEVPGFGDVEKSITRIIGQYLDEMYFLQGETIVNYNDVQEHMYLLYRGKVELLSKDGGLIATMGRGGLFGNVSNTPYSLSSVMVVASKNIDVLRLDCKTFFKALQVSPNTKTLLNFLTSKKRDYIMPLTVALNVSSAVTIPYEITAQSPTPSSLLQAQAQQSPRGSPSACSPNLPLFQTIRAVRPLMHFSDANLTTAQSSFHMRNNVYKAAGKRLCTFVILPETGLCNTIEILVVILAYLSSALTMYTIAFQDTTTPTLIISYVLDFLFYVKIALRYHMSHFDKFGDYVIDTHMIAKRYHTSRSMIFDAVSNLPLEIFALAAPTDWRLRALSILRLNRVVRLGFIFEYHQLKLQTLMVNKIYLEFCWILICATLMFHFFACLWIFVVCPLGECFEPCFVTEMELQEKGRLELYVISMYYIVVIMTTVGFSGVPIYSTRELVMSVTIIISCRFAVVLLIGTLTAALNAQSAHLFIYQERISALKESFCNRNIREYQIGKMWNYLKSLWFFKSGRQIPKFITLAPYAMRCEVMSAMFGSHLSQSYIFADVDKAFLRQLAIHLQRSVYFPGNYILQQGDIDHTMYFIRKGKVSVLTIHPDLMETIHFTLADGDNFGMTQGLVVGAAHQFSYRAQTDVVILSLTLSHWKHLLKHFPQAEQEIYMKLKALPKEQEK